MRELRPHAYYVVMRLRLNIASKART
jgi:hypothetical protein